MEHFACEPIATTPKLAVRIRAPLFMVINFLLMRTSDNAVGHHNRQNAMLRNELQYFTGHLGIITDISPIHFPIAHLSDVCILRCTMPTATLVARVRLGP